MLDKFPSLNPKIEELYEFSKAVADLVHRERSKELSVAINDLLHIELAKFVLVFNLSQINPDWITKAVFFVNEWYITHNDPMPTETLIHKLLGRYVEGESELLIDYLVAHGLIKVSEGSFNDMVLRFVHMHNVAEPTNKYLEAELEIEPRVAAAQRSKHG